ncbi:DUF5689 domain-containing protein [Pontibacter pamirensis]|uniref:DUF5689 domain-containing protein n=1 Tax=Pontibacter pamirensis TaxID=2562824 RepID=UPI0013896CBE|nr:DUF5689 domain-containing protein [Pontibacter pamirensis]
MKKLLQSMYGFGILACLGMTSEALGQDVFINEIHYDNASADVNEAIEVAGPAGTDLTGWSLMLYNGNNGAAYDTEALTGVIPDQSNGAGTLYFPVAGIQNGSPDGIALIDAAGNVVQFLSYEGAFAAIGGPADGMSSTDIGVSQPGTGPADFSLQLTGTGRTYSDFTWAAETLNTFGAVNTGQSFGEGGGTNPEPEPDPEPEPSTTIVFINEIHYDNSGTDEGEGVEVAGLAGTDLTGWQLVPYNGNGGGAYSTLTLSGTIPDQQAGFGTIFFPISGLQNGAPDGVALVDAAGNVIQFLSYEGTFAATNGPATGLTSTDIGVEEGGSTPVGFSLQLTGTGSAYEDFTWAAENTATYSAVNNGQVFLPLQDIVFINEIHYDNDGADTGEAIEVAGRAGTDISGWSLVLYNGNNGAPYNTTGLTGIIPDQNNGFGFVSVTYPANGIQNGAPDGVALVNADGEVVQFLSYEGTFTAVGGPADGLESTNIGVEEASTTAIGYSLQLTGTGFTYEDFTWSEPINSTFGAINASQDFGGGTTNPEPVEPQEVTIAEARGLPLGTPVIVNGTLTATDQLGGPAFIQDGTGGIALFDYQVQAEDAFSIGDSIQVTASIGAFNQQVQLIEVTNMESFGAATQPIAPVQVTIAELNSALEGQLVTIPNASFTDIRGLLFPESNYTIKDGTATIDLRIDGDVESLVGREVPDNTVNMTGVVGSFRGTLQLLPRFIEDLPGTTPYEPAGTEIPISRTLDVMTWNMEFFGSTIPTFGPTDVQLQLQNAARLIDSVHADVIAVQEISDENLLQQLVDMLPGYAKVCSDRFSYSYNGPDPTFPEQKLCFIYNTEVITLVDERVIFEELYDAARSGVSTPLDMYPTSPSSFWSSGRLPYMITVDATVEGVTERVQLINIHAKSGAASADLIRRSFDTQALKDTLEQYYPDANIILLGDYNDDVDESIGGGPSTYSNFVQAEDFRVVTSTLSEAGLRSFIARDNVIDHITISNELYDDYLVGSASLVIPFNWIENYASTTSDHLPVFTRFEFTEPLMMDAGADKTVYYGYAPEACTTLSASAATGGVAGYTYTWSNGQTGQTIEVCPQESTTYTLTVTDSRGVSVTDEVQVCVVNVSCGDTNNPKVQVYYNPTGKEGKGHSLCISENAVPAHLALGAVLGDGTATSCDGSLVTPGAVNLKELFSLVVYPNPVSDYLNIISDKVADCAVEVMLYDINGNEVYKNSHSIQNSSLSIDIRNVRLSKGLNYLKVSSEYGTQTMRIIKN